MMTLFSKVPTKTELLAFPSNKIDLRRYDKKEKVTSIKLLAVVDGQIIELARFESFYSKNASASICYSRLNLKIYDYNYVWVESKTSGYGYSKEDHNLYSMVRTLGFETASSGQRDAYLVMYALAVEFYGLGDSDYHICQG